MHAADSDQRAQRRRFGRANDESAKTAQRAAAKDLLFVPSQRGTADVRVVRQRSGALPLFVQALH